MKKFLNGSLTYFLFALCLAEAFYLGWKWPHSILPHIDPRLQEYVDRFVADADSFGVEIYPESIGLVEFSSQMPSDTVGFCNSAGMAWARLGFEHTNTLFINTTIESEIGTPYFLAVMYHELGHCLLDKGHDKEGSLTIMDPAPYGSNAFWERTWQQQVNDLFVRPDGEPAPNYQQEYRP